MSTMDKRMRGLCRSPRDQVVANLNEVLRVLPLIQIQNTDYTSAASLKIIERTVHMMLADLHGARDLDPSFVMETCRSYLPVMSNMVDCIPMSASALIPHPLIVLKAELNNALLYSSCGEYLN